MKNDVIISPASKPMSIAEHTYQIEGFSLNSTSLADEGSYKCTVMINGVVNSHSQRIDLHFIGGKFFFTRKIYLYYLLTLQ